MEITYLRQIAFASKNIRRKSNLHIKETIFFAHITSHYPWFIVVGKDGEMNPDLGRKI
jgi:hypothetical protein